MPQVLELVDALLQAAAADARVWSFALAAPLSLESLAAAARHARQCPAEVWCTVVLPVLRAHIAQMRSDGVSGDQRDQSVVSLAQEVRAPLPSCSVGRSSIIWSPTLTSAVAVPAAALRAS
jgi:hypothetical protein